MKLTKQELKNILEQGWEARRLRAKEKSQRDCENTKEWKKREVKIKKGELPEPRRREGYLG
jgi:hypothetical protein